MERKAGCCLPSEAARRYRPRKSRRSRTPPLLARCASRSPHVEVGSRLPSLQLSVSRILPAACHKAERPPFALDKTFHYLPVFAFLRSEEHTSELQSIMRIS